MRLKTLEIKGFKSFADKTLLKFDEGITGVIGPNGCGKSNIIDSIRWVIGEQKISQLRSENLESLVFNGSKSRGASGLAEVSLTFENTKNLLPTEFNTVTVTRKYYKNGESEYRLNDVSCRLKDIHNLFMDTGISTDSYAIIELGMVDDIIKDKENSRRRMLEQAAGITIYKTRKKEAKLKLDATDQDLARIEDLLFEINNQLKVLEGQSKKAEKYLEVKKEYRLVSIELAKAALEGFHLTYRDLNQQQEDESDKRTQLRSSLSTEEADLEKEKAAFIEKEKALQQQQHVFNEISNQLKEKENQKNLSDQRLQYLKERENSLNEFLGKATGQLSGLDESISFTKVQLADEETKLTGLKQALETHKVNAETKRSHFDEKRKALDNLRQAQLQLQRNHFEAEKKVAVADTSIVNITQAIAQLNEEQTLREQTLANISQQKIEKENNIEVQKKHLAELEKSDAEIRQQLLDTQKKMEELRLQIAAESRLLDAKQNEYDLLRSLVDKMEGYPESVKFLHNNPKWAEAPLLSDVIYVKEEYRAAVENVLEPYLNYYVADNIEEALKAVNLLDENKKGKAKFFLLNELKNYNAPAISTPAHTVAALSVIEADDRFSPLTKYLLGNVFIGEGQVEVAGISNIVILEKSGKYLRGPFTLSGGSLGMFEGKKIGRAKNLEKLNEGIVAQKTKVTTLQNQITECSGQIARLNEALKENDIQKTRQLLNQLNNELFAVQNRIENTTQQKGNAEQKINDLTTQLAQAHSSIELTRGQLGQLSNEVTNHDQQLNIGTTEFAKTENEYNELNRIYNDSNLQLTRQQSKISSLQQELDFKSKQFTELNIQKENSEHQLAESSKNLSTTQEELKNIGDAIVVMLKQRQEEESKLNAADQNYYHLRNELTEKESALRHKQRAIEQTDLLLNEIKDRLNELKLRLAGMKERLQVEFKIDLDTILDEERQTDTSVDELQEKSDRMKKRLENMGEINPTAIEAFTEMKKRFDFINEQKDDLVKARQSLLQTIEEVEATANQKFLETFNQVRENFQNVFKALFTEDDTADMVLDNPENLAETGIDIVAKPKGKRPTSITQLSGGEKTLTATALLFAIYLIKPAPFCILDEVDAPLDDANIGKFTQMIRKFSTESQFIIVTHNKMTMASVDVIYGVTMQEAGVSKLVPVDFRGLDHQFVN
ncbi:MAG: chromosome segregation protein SMC [Bacteroidetes bacterium]|nr:chromosome segregation protein SMC [Bacteroidota bacterium]